jgi:hypothetical protein
MWKWTAQQQIVICLSKQRENSRRVISLRVILLSLARRVTYQRIGYYLPAALIELIIGWKRER